jgi:Ca-activated chloride channel family protein
MKALIPYAILGVIGTAGAVAGTSVPTSLPPAVPAATPVTKAQNGPVLVHAALDRTVLPAAGGEVFARIALEGVMPQVQEKARVPVSLTLVIDRSGSMGSGTKMADAKRAAAEAILALRPGDKVCVISFDDGAQDHGCASVSSAQAQGDLAVLTRAIDFLHPRGGTDMIAGLDVGGRAAGRIHGDERVNRLLLLSDGRPDTEVGLKEHAGTLAKKGIQTTTLGLGEDYNEDLMAAIADLGLGHYYFVAEPHMLAKIFAEELESLASIVAREASLTITPRNGARVVEVIGFPSQGGGAATHIAAGDIYGGRTTDVLVRLAVGPSKPSSASDVVAVQVAYTPAAGGARVQDDRVLVASRSLDARAVEKSLVPEVAVKVEKFRAAQAWITANAAYDRGDKAEGDRVMLGSSARLASQAELLKDDDLAKESSEQKLYQVQNEAGGAEWRGMGTRAAKKKAWSMNKGSAY